MIRLRLLLAVLALAMPPVFAAAPVLADLDVKNFQFAPDVYHDLPGVKAPEDLANLPDPYRCESTLLPTTNPQGRYRDTFGRRGLPVSGYKCVSTNGTVYYGTAHPKARNNHPQIEPYSPL